MEDETAMNIGANPALELAKPLVETACSLISKLLDRPFRLASGIVSDELNYWRWRNRVRIFSRAQQVLERHSLAARVVSPSFMLPLLESAGDVEDDDLQSLWATLIVNASQDAVHRHPAFIDILRQITRDEAMILTTVATSRSMPVLFIAEEHSAYNATRFVSEIPHRLQLSEPTMLDAYIDNLERLGLLSSIAVDPADADHLDFAAIERLPEFVKLNLRKADRVRDQGYFPGIVSTSLFGERFHRACSAPPRDEQATV
jgi:hypothetical protein